MLGPGRSWSFRDTPEDDLAEASNTTQSFVVVLASFNTPCMGR